MKKIGIIILSLVLALNLCAGFGGAQAENTDNIVYKTSADGQFKYHIEDWSGDGTGVYAVADEYLGTSRVVSMPAKIDGLRVTYEDNFYKSLKAEKIIFNGDFGSGMVYATNLKEIELSADADTELYYIYDNCLYKRFDIYDGEEKLGDPILYGIPGGLTEITLKNDTLIGGYPEKSRNLKKIYTQEGNTMYKSVDGVLLDSDGRVWAIPGNYTEGTGVLKLPAGSKSLMSHWNEGLTLKEIVFPEGFETFTFPTHLLEGTKTPDTLSVLRFPDTLNQIYAWIGDGDTWDYGIGNISDAYSCECTSIKKIYINMLEKEAEQRVKYNEFGPLGSSLNDTLKIYAPNATIIYAKSINIDSSIVGGEITTPLNFALEDSPVEITVKADNGYQLKKLTVSDKSGKEVEVKDNKFVMPDSDVTISAEFEKISSGNQDSDKKDDQKDADKNNSADKDDKTDDNKSDEKKGDKTPVTAKYSDVPTSGKWYSEAVYYATAKGYMAGTGNNKFSPDATVTRGTIAQILYAAEGKPAVSGRSQFTDVGETKWYAKAVKWAADKGLVSGYGNGKFGPEDRITREQMVAIMMQYSKMKGYDTSANADLSKFRDQNTISKWAVNAVKWGVSHKIVSGTDKGSEPKGNATRAQIAVILQAYDKNLRK